MHKFFFFYPILSITLILLPVYYCRIVQDACFFLFLFLISSSFFSVAHLPQLISLRQFLDILDELLEQAIIIEQIHSADLTISVNHHLDLFLKTLVEPNHSTSSSSVPSPVADRSTPPTSSDISYPPVSFSEQSALPLNSLHSSPFSYYQKPLYSPSQSDPPSPPGLITSYSPVSSISFHSPRTPSPSPLNTTSPPFPPSLFIYHGPFGAHFRAQLAQLQRAQPPPFPSPPPPWSALPTHTHTLIRIVIKIHIVKRIFTQ